MPIKIAIIGPESSGKSALTPWLADQLSCGYVSEYAREYIPTINRDVVYEDLDVILTEQLRREDQFENDEFLVCDTETIVVKVWAEVVYGKVSPFIHSAWKNRHYDFTLLCYPDLPWEPDPLRSIPDWEGRKAIFDTYEKELKVLGRPYAVVKGQGNQRFQNALELISGVL